MINEREGLRYYLVFIYYDCSDQLIKERGEISLMYIEMINYCK